MQDNFSDTQVIRKRVVATRGGVVAAQHKRAAQIGAEILAAGGDAIDAAAATSFAIGVVEPWMSGIAAGGAMVIWRAAQEKAYVVDYGMRSPAALNPADYPVVGGRDPELFAWPRVKDDRNVQGASAVAVPGVVAGMELAHQRYGRLPWRRVVAPAARLAREGMLLDWYAGLLIASTAQPLSLDPDAAALFLEDGKWPPLAGWTATTEKHLDQRRLADTLDVIARDGARALYRGEIGAAIVKDVRDKGGCLSLEDLASYRAELGAPLDVRYRGGQIHAAPGMTGGPVLAACLEDLSRVPRPRYA
ncbi:MAG TPA: gamma-glutamyltransferase, partial [Burkholderiales bacterium]|nr:gamma-glutamyltransferase [Burkholderiales bacterium]